MKGRMLVVFPFYADGAQGNELELAIKGWKKFCKFECEIVVVGDMPKSYTLLDDVTYIPIKRVMYSEAQYTPNLDTQNKYRAVYNRYRGEYDGFIRMADDYYAIAPFGLDDITPSFYKSDSYSVRYDYDPDCYLCDKKKTKALLDSIGCPVVDYSTHYPCYVKFQEFNAIWKKYDLAHNSYILEDLLFNMFPHNPQPIGRRVAHSVTPDFDIVSVRDAIESGALFYSGSFQSWSSEMEEGLYKYYGIG